MDSEGRANVVRVFEYFFITDGHTQASILMKNLYDISSKNEDDIKDIARFAVGALITVLCEHRTCRVLDGISDVNPSWLSRWALVRG